MRVRLFLGLTVVAAAAVVALAVVRHAGSGPALDDTATIGRARAATTVARPSTTVAPATTTTVAAQAEARGLVPDASAGQEPPPGLVITNSGSATASVGGNVVSGGTPVTVVTGDATAVGNSSTVRAP
ncbi:MAG: hypothetical protein QOG43_29 [Actinomycetota bacterium]|nr:hypothetical protein [Actinomycetota bacterium]